MSNISRISRNFGCEFEFSTEFKDIKISTTNAIKTVYKDNILKAKNAWYKSNNNFKFWHLKIDSSTLSELCTPVSTYEDIPNICSVLGIIGKDESTKITKKDSLHVHMDVKDIPRENILILWLKYEKLILSLFPLHRRNNMYCERSVDHHLRSSKQISEYFKSALKKTTDHHSAISFFFYKKNTANKRRRCRNTVEFRIAEGTTDRGFIRSWVVFLFYFLAACKKLKAPIEAICESTADMSKLGLDLMICELKITDKRVIEWLHMRFYKFNKTI